MLYDLGLIAALAVCSWIGLDSLAVSRFGRRVSAIAVLSLSATLWIAGELLLTRAAGPEELAIGRRVLYLGACSIAFAWLWVSIEAARPRWFLRAPWLLALAALPSVCVYATLYMSTPGFVDPFAPRGSAQGPLFPAHRVYAWGMGIFGCYYFAKAALRLRKASPQRMAALAAGALLPLAGNLAYGLVAPGVLPLDPTPLLIGVGGLLVRVAVFDSGLTRALPLGHKEVVDQLDVGVLVADLDGRVVDANAAACELLGVENPAGGSLDRILSDLGRDEARSIEVRTFPLRTSFAIAGRGAVLTDRTETQRAQRRLQLAARLEAVGTLTAGIAHEVNNPLAFIRANLNHLEKTAWSFAKPELRSLLPPDVAELAEETPELLAETMDGVDRIRALVERLRSFAREEPVARVPKEVDLHRVVELAVPMARAGLPPDSIEVRLAAVPAVLGVEGDFVQILLNLLVNALQASEAHVPVEVEVAPENHGAVLRVLDRGSGIEPEVREHIFDPFYTTKPVGSGTGLGLSLSYELAMQHGGRLETWPREGGGTVFSLWLPSADALGT